MLFPLSIGFVLASIFISSAVAGHVQFVDSSSNLGFALSTFSSSSSTDLLFQLSVPKSAGWGAVGVGNVMDGSLMFIIYPSSDQQKATLSVRTASGHNDPTSVSDVDFSVESSSITDSTMTANVICRNCTHAPNGVTLSTTSTNQIWIWAIGPGSSVSSDSLDADIQQHSGFGTFSVSMPSASSTSPDTIPTISGTSESAVVIVPSYFSTLVAIHAILLGGSFALLFPLGIIVLRWFGNFKLHWRIQLFAALACTTGLSIAVVLSRADPEFASFGSAHQIIGILVVAMLFFQAYFGYAHHANFKKHGHKTPVSHFHLWMGRLVVPLGMLDISLGFKLASQTAQGIAAAGVSVVVLIATYLISWLVARRKSRKTVSNDIPLGPYSSLHD